MDYQIFEPSQELRPLVKCYWTLESPKEEIPEKQTIVPDGCVEMIFHYGDLFNENYHLEKKAVVIIPGIGHRSLVHEKRNFL